MRIFDLHTSKARYELKLWRVNVKTVAGFINIPLGDLSHISLRHNNIYNRERTEDAMHAEQRGI